MVNIIYIFTIYINLKTGKKWKREEHTVNLKVIERRPKVTVFEWEGIWTSANKSSWKVKGKKASWEGKDGKEKGPKKRIATVKQERRVKKSKIIGEGEGRVHGGWGRGRDGGRERVSAHESTRTSRGAWMPAGHLGVLSRDIGSSYNTFYLRMEPTATWYIFPDPIFVAFWPPSRGDGNAGGALVDTCRESIAKGWRSGWTG